MSDRTEQPAFPLLDLRSRKDERPYDTFHLRGLRDAEQCLGRYATGATSIVFQSSDAPDDNEHRQTRPLGSILEQTMLITPFYVDPDLEHLFVTHHLRVGYGDPTDPIDNPPPLRIRYGFTVNFESGWYHVHPEQNDDGNGWKWQTVTHLVRVDDGEGDIKPGWNTFYIAIKSDVHEDVRDPDQWEYDHGWEMPDEVHTFTENLSSEDSHASRLTTDGVDLWEHGDAADSPNATDPETSCSLILRATGQTGTAESIKTLAHSRAITSTSMRIFPRWYPLDGGDDLHHVGVGTAPISHGQWRSVSVEPVVDTDASVTSLRSESSAKAPAYRSLRMDLRGVAQRPVPVQIGHPGFIPDESVDGDGTTFIHWRDRAYRCGFPFHRGGHDPLEIPAGTTQGSVSRQRRMKLLVTCVYASHNDGLQDETFEDGIEDGVNLVVEFGGEEREMTAVPLFRSDEAPFVWAMCEHLDFEEYTDTKAMGNLATDLSYLEGGLQLERGDTDIWNSVEIPLDDDQDRLSVSIDTSSLEFVDGASGDMQDGTGGAPIVERCFVFILGYSIYEFGGAL